MRHQKQIKLHHQFLNKKISLKHKLVHRIPNKLLSEFQRSHVTKIVKQLRQKDSTHKTQQSQI